MDDQPGPVTADDVLAAVAASVAALRPVAGGDWSTPAGDLTWTCWETVEHLADDLFCYAAQLGADGYPRYLPFEAAPRYPGGEPNTIRSNPAAGPDGLFQLLTATAGLLAAMVRMTPPTVRAHHTFGPADPGASAAMGVLETLVHTSDVARGLGAGWTPDPALCARVLARLMPEVDRTEDAWADLLWACGRATLPGRPRREGWRWHNTSPDPNLSGTAPT